MNSTAKKIGIQFSDIAKEILSGIGSDFYLFFSVLCVALLLLPIFHLYGQKTPQAVFLDSSTYTYHFSITGHKLSSKSKQLYTWYKAGKILQTQFGYGGHLLDGKFTKNFLSKNLAQQGYYRTGIKTGIWKTWYDNGLLSEISHWHKGKMKGKFQCFDSLGKFTRTGVMNNGLFSGKEYHYLGDTAKVLLYKNGLAITAESKKGDSTQNNNK